MWLLSLIVGTAGAFAQQFELRGTVLDNTDEPLPGATVRVKNTQTGVSTDIEGRFILQVKKGDVLNVSYVGYLPQDVTVTGENNIKVVLQDNAQALNEVVVVGYGTMRKKDLTGAVTQINPDKIADTNPASVQDLLRSAPGLQIGYDASAKGTGASIRLRGQNSLGTDASPMIVLDGMPFYGELSEINPDNIGQIDILKDASSAAIYGARAAAGVIIITTKKGKTGKPTVTVSANVGVSNKYKYNDFMNVDEYLQYRQDWYATFYSYGQNPETGLYEYYQAKDKNGALLYPQGYFHNPAGLEGDALNSWLNTTGKSGFGPAAGEDAHALWGRRMELTNSELAYQNFLAGKTYDWNKATFRTGINQDYNIALSGATDNVNYYMSAGMVNNEGAVQGNEYKAFRANMKLNAKVTNWLEVGANVNFQDRTDGDIQVSLGSNYWDDNMLRNSPYAAMYTEDGKYQQYPMSGKPTNSGYNYYFQRQYYDLDKGYTNLNTIFNAKVTLPYGFTYQLNVSPRYQWFHDLYFMDSNLPGSSVSSRGVNRNNSRYFDWNLNNTLTWDKTYLDLHHFTVTLVQEAEEHKAWTDGIAARNIQPTDALGFHYVAGANKEQSSFSSNDWHYTGASYLGRAFYSFDNKYMLTTTFRRDGYSGFGANNKWGNFGSVGLGWNFSDEKFMEETRSWLDNAKLRVSWGTNGNRDFGDVYKTLANLALSGKMVYYNNGNSTVVPGLVMDRLASPNLRWERTEAWNGGLDFSIFNSRLTGNLDIYHKVTRDMIMSQRLPYFTGFGSIATNLGEVQNDGFELGLNSINIEQKDFTWTTNVGLSYNKNRINHLYYNYDENGKELDDTSNNWYIGHAIGEMWYWESDGVWQNTPEDIAAAALVGQRPGDPKIKNNFTEDDKIVKNADGTETRIPVYNEKDKSFLGPRVAPWFLNVRNEFVYKDFTFAFSFYSKLGHKLRSGMWLNQDNGGSNVTNGMNIVAKKYWTPSNPTNDYCRLQAVGPNTGLADGIEKTYSANFLRVDNVTLGYNLPSVLSRKANIERVRFTVGINNLCTISGWEYADPETQGLSRRTFNFGVNITL